MIKCEIDRKKWYRGHGSMYSRLLKTDGSMCCMGFLAKEMGVNDWAILDVPSFSQANTVLMDFHDKHEEYVFKLYETNDMQGLDEDSRETQIQQFGKEIGVDFAFKN